MLQREFIDALRRTAVASKEYVTRKRPMDINPFVIAHRGDDPIAMVTVKRQSPEAILAVTRLMASGFDADQMGVVFETYQSQMDPELKAAAINPMTGEIWKPGELVDAVENHDGIAQGWATEALSLTAVNRAGDLSVLNIPYRYSGKHLVWLSDLEQDWSAIDNAQTRGGMVEELTALMEAPSATHLLRDYPPDRDGRDLAVGDHLAKQGHAVQMFSRAGDIARRARFMQ